MPPPSLAGVHVFGLPGGVQEANGAAAAHGVAHGGDAIQGQQHLPSTSPQTAARCWHEGGGGEPFCVGAAWPRPSGEPSTPAPFRSLRQPTEGHSPSLSWNVLQGGTKPGAFCSLTWDLCSVTGRCSPALCASVLPVLSSHRNRSLGGRLEADPPLLSFSAPPAPSSSCRRRTCRAT